MKTQAMLLVLHAMTFGNLLGQEFPQATNVKWNDGVQRITNAAQISAAINLELSPLERRKISLQTEQSQLRGAESAAVYQEVAPAVVYITDGVSGHGTGFFIGERGWIVTNNHVIEEMPYDAATGVREARIITGHIATDGMMTDDDGFQIADVYRVDEIRDLAVLKLRLNEQSLPEYSVIELADLPPVPGAICIAIGHPAQGVLWTLRQGEIAGRGDFPRDQIGDFFQKGADTSITNSLTSVLALLPCRKVLLSTCGLNPGDSGGPLLDEAGKLVGVSFAVPTIDQARGIDLGKFSFHIHLDEVKTFLSNRPENPDVLPPSMLPPATFETLIDIDNDNRLDTWVFGVDLEESPTGLFFDLDQDSDAQLKAIDEAGGLTGKSPINDWDWEIAFTFAPRQSVFVDHNNDGQTDLVLVKHSAEEFVGFDLHTSGQWNASPRNGKLEEFEFFDSQDLNQKIREILLQLN